jgi:SAM-dependent MidA family methyltransferase
MERIRDEGPLSFETFMDMALYYPGLGYYMSPDVRIGKEGDYYTTPHVHSFFGAALARQIEQMWKLLGSPQQFTIVEVGPGRGFLSLDILTSLMTKPIFSALEYKLVELNPFMKKIQKHVLKEFDLLTQWYDNLTDIPPFKGCIIAHEVIDSFPVRVVEQEEEEEANGKRMTEIYVTQEQGELREMRQPAARDIIEYFSERNLRLPGNYRTEVNFRLHKWLSNAASALSEGFLIIIDYGYTLQDYYAPERNKGTFICYFQHQLCYNPFERIGEQDMTCHVNFYDLKRWGNNAGLIPVGFCSQARFLIALGIDKMISGLDKNRADYFREIGRVKNLLLDTGQSHYVMALVKGRSSFELRGFSVRNQINSI